MEENGNSSKGGLFMQYRPVLIALIAGICAIICVSIFTGNIIQYKKNAGGTGSTATGSASVDFESDLVVWRGSFSEVLSPGQRRGRERDGIQLRQHFPHLYVPVR